MGLFKSTDVKEAERRVREEERAKASAARLEMIREYDKKIEFAMKLVAREKNVEIANLRRLVDAKIDVFKRFKRDVERMDILATEMSALGEAIENLTGGVTRKFHGFKTGIEMIRASVRKKENKYKQILEMSHDVVSPTKVPTAKDIELAYRAGTNSIDRTRLQ